MATQEADTARAQALEDDGVVSQVQHQVQEKAHDLKGQASQNVRRQLNDRSTEVGEQIHSLGAALRRAAEQLAEDGKTTPAEAQWAWNGSAAIYATATRTTSSRMSSGSGALGLG
jgi:paraquat-inducible protein B